MEDGWEDRNVCLALGAVWAPGTPGCPSCRQQGLNTGLTSFHRLFLRAICLASWSKRRQQEQVLMGYWLPVELVVIEQFSTKKQYCWKETRCMNVLTPVMIFDGRKPDTQSQYHSTVTLPLIVVFVYEQYEFGLWRPKSNNFPLPLMFLGRQLFEDSYWFFSSYPTLPWTALPKPVGFIKQKTMPLGSLLCIKSLCCWQWLKRLAFMCGFL